MQVYEFNGKKYKVSGRNSSDVKVGDVVLLTNPGDDYTDWSPAEIKMVGKCFEVQCIFPQFHTARFKASGNNWGWDKIHIMEEISDKTPRNHPHAEMIRQWLDDASLEVEYRSNRSESWSRSGIPTWEPTWQYRFKPKTVPAWKVLYEYGSGDIDLTAGHYRNEEEFNKNMTCNEKFIKFVLETERQFPV